jgi:hypothetical protein
MYHDMDVGALCNKLYGRLLLRKARYPIVVHEAEL